MKILGCGTGFNTTSLVEVCLERGITIGGFVDVIGDNACGESTDRMGTPLFRILKRIYDSLDRPGQQLCLRLAAYAGISAPTGPISANYLFRERLEGLRVIPLSQVPQEDFDYIVIAHPEYEQFRSRFVALGVRNANILSLIYDPKRAMKKLGPVKFFLGRRKKIVEGKPKRDYELFKLEGLSTAGVPSVISEKEQYPVVEKLIDACNAALRDTAEALPPYRHGSNWLAYLRMTRGDLWDLLAKRDVSRLTELLNNCLRNRLTEGMYGGATAFNHWKSVDYAVQIERMAACYLAWAYTIHEDPDLSELGMPPIGNPYGLKLGGAIVNANCFYNHYRSVFASRLTGEMDRPVIAEIGGGVGLFGYYLLKRNPNLVYMDFDLPENLFVASYYLSMAFPEKRILYYEGADSDLTKAVFGNHDIILMPNLMLSRLADRSVDMFVNTISLSEMDYETIVEYLRQIQRCTKRYFYQENLADFNFAYKSYPVDFFPNLDGFTELMTSQSRWPHFSFTSPEHKYTETLYERRDT